MRLAQMQVWPAFLKPEATTPAAAVSTSASSNTMKGALPPSSSETRFTVSAAPAISDLPTAVEPVKPIFLTVSDSSIVFPADPPKHEATHPAVLKSAAGTVGKVRCKQPCCTATLLPLIRY